MICTFFGHRDAPSSLFEEIKKAILKELKGRDCEFWVGNNGAFDYMVQMALWELKNSGYNIKIKVVLSHICERAISEKQELTVFPEELACVPKRLAILKRNDYLIKSSSVAIVYERYNASNTHKQVIKAQKRGLRIIKL